MAYYVATFIGLLLLIMHLTVFPVKGQCTVQGCDNGDTLICIFAEIQQLKVELFAKLDKQVQSIPKLDASFQEMKVNETSSIVPPECCSFPFSYNGAIFYTCAQNITDPSDIGCFRVNYSWTTCLSINFKANYVSHNLTIPNTAQPVPSISIHGWLIIQKNVPDSGSIFNRSWIDYRNGFGDPAGKYFWFGNEKLYQLLFSGNWKLRVEVQSSDTGKWYSAEYESFSLSNEATKYVINVSGYTGDAGDAFNDASSNNWKTNGMKFTTIDNDNDNNPNGKCAGGTGGWWWNKCGTSTLNSYTSVGNSWGTLQLLGLAPTRYVSNGRMMIKKA